MNEDEYLKEKKKEVEQKRMIAETLTQLFEPMLSEHDVGKATILFGKIMNKIGDLADPEVLMKDEEKTKRVLLFFEQINALVGQFIENERRKNNE